MIPLFGHSDGRRLLTGCWLPNRELGPMTDAERFLGALAHPRTTARDTLHRTHTYRRLMSMVFGLMLAAQFPLPVALEDGRIGCCTSDALHDRSLAYHGPPSCHTTRKVVVPGKDE